MKRWNGHTHGLSKRHDGRVAILSAGYGNPVALKVFSSICNLTNMILMLLHFTHSLKVMGTFLSFLSTLTLWLQCIEFPFCLFPYMGCSPSSLFRSDCLRVWLCLFPSIQIHSEYVCLCYSIKVSCADCCPPTKNSFQIDRHENNNDTFFVISPLS